MKQLLMSDWVFSGAALFAVVSVAWFTFRAIWHSQPDPGIDATEVCTECLTVHKSKDMVTLVCGSSAARLCRCCFDRKPKKEWNIQPKAS